MNAELQAVQAKRRVTEAKLNNGFSARVSATVGFNQRASVFDDAYQDLAQRQQYGVNVQNADRPVGESQGAGRSSAGRAGADERTTHVPLATQRQRKRTSPPCNSRSPPAT